MRGFILALLFIIGNYTNVFAQQTKNKYDKVDKHFRNGRLLVESGGKFGYVDPQFKEVVPPRYEDAQPFYKLVAIVKKNGKYGLINTQGIEIVAATFDEIRYLKNDLLAVRTENKYGLVDITGAELVTPEYESIRCTIGGLLEVRRNNKVYMIDREGQQIIPLQYVVTSKKAAHFWLFKTMSWAK